MVPQCFSGNSCFIVKQLLDESRIINLFLEYYYQHNLLISYLDDKYELFELHSLKNVYRLFNGVLSNAKYITVQIIVSIQSNT